MDKSDLEPIKFNEALYVSNEYAPDPKLDLQETETYLQNHPNDVLALVLPPS